VTLQPLRTAGESARFAQHAHTLSIEETARVMAGCDLVVTVDTMAAHLAGALGVSGCVMLRAEADWRWMNDRSDSPWYPSLTLFRQPWAGEWRSVVGAVRDFLLRALSARHSRQAR
jgi:Glycosyltransferase family 9 (heptosyltransferase)